MVGRPKGEVAGPGREGGYEYESTTHWELGIGGNWAA